MGANNVYSAIYDQTITKNSTDNSASRIVLNQRQAQIKSISVDWQIIDQTGKVIPLDVNTTQVIEVLLYQLPNKITRSFESIGGGFEFTSTAQIIRITKPCQLLLNSFFVTNNLDIEVTIINKDAVNDIHHKVCIIVETVEKILY